MGDVEKKIPDNSGLMTTPISNQKVSEGENKIPDTSGLVTKAILNTKISKLRTNFSVIVITYYDS